MKKNATLTKFGFKLPKKAEAKADSQHDPGPPAPDSNVMDVGDEHQAKETEIEEIDSTFPFFAHNNKSLPAVFGFQLTFLQELTKIPRMDGFDDDTWRFILCKQAAHNPELMLSIECQVLHAQMDSEIADISTAPKSIEIKENIWNYDIFHKINPTASNLLDKMWDKYNSSAQEALKESEEQAAAYLLDCYSKAIPIGLTTYFIQFADDPALHSIHHSLNTASTVVDHQVKIHHLSQIIENDGKFLLAANIEETAMANISYGGYIIMAKMLAGSNFPLDSNRDIATCFQSKISWFEKDLLLKIKRVCGWLIASTDKNIEEIGDNEQLAFQKEDLRKLNRTKDCPNYNIFTPEEFGVYLTSSNHLSNCNASVKQLVHAIQTSFKICITENEIGLIDGPVLIDPDISLQLIHSITENALAAFNTTYSDLPALTRNHALHLERLTTPLDSSLEYSHFLFTGIPPFLTEDTNKLVIELSTICALHSDLGLTENHISSNIAKDNSWHINLGNRHGILLTLPLPHSTSEPTFIGMVTTSFSKQHKYIATLLTPAEAKNLTSGQLLIMSVWRNFGTSPALLSRGRGLIKDLLDNLLPNAFTVVPHSVQHNFSNRKGKDSDNKNIRFEESLILAITNNLSVSKRGRQLLNPTLGTDNKPAYIDLSYWTFEVHHCIENVANQKYFFPSALTNNVKMMHVSSPGTTNTQDILAILESIIPIDYIILLFPPVEMENPPTWSAMLPPLFDEDIIEPTQLTSLRHSNTTISFSIQLVNNTSNIPLFDPSKRDPPPSITRFDSWFKTSEAAATAKQVFKSKPWQDPLPSSLKNLPQLSNSTSSSTSSHTSLSTHFKQTVGKPNEVVTFNPATQLAAFNTFVTETRGAIKVGTENHILLQTAIQDVAHNLRVAEDMRARERIAAAEADKRREETLERIITDTVSAAIHGFTANIPRPN